MCFIMTIVRKILLIDTSHYSNLYPFYIGPGPSQSDINNGKDFVKSRTALIDYRNGMSSHRLMPFSVGVLR